MFGRVVGERAEAGREETLDGATGEAIEGSPDPEPGLGRHASPDVYEKECGEGSRHQDIKDTEAVGEVIGNETPGTAGDVEQEEEVEGLLVREHRRDLGRSVGGKIVKGEKDAQNKAEGTSGVEGVGQLAEGGPLN